MVNFHNVLQTASFSFAYLFEASKREVLIAAFISLFSRDRTPHFSGSGDEVEEVKAPPSIENDLLPWTLAPSREADIFGSLAAMPLPIDNSSDEEEAKVEIP